MVEGRADVELAEAAGAFSAGAAGLVTEPLGSGHIHRTWLATWADGNAAALVLQRLNTGVFPDTAGLMQNLERVTSHLAAKLRASGAPDAERRALRLVAPREGGWLHRDPAGGAWRAFHFVSGTRSFDAIEDTEQARAAAKAFGAFAAQLADLSGPPLHDTIPHFHDLVRRVASLDAAVARDLLGRGAGAVPEIASLRDALQGLEAVLPAAARAALPRRIAHHDCKLNNVLFDARSGEPLCVVDLDTVMPGLLLSDFGGLVRTATTRAAEDERDLSRVVFDLDLFEALARGYLEGAGAILEAAEREALAAAGLFHTLLDATRFLTDHLEGDVYFRVHREGHNLDRARTQLRLAEQMLARHEQLRAIFARLGRA